MLYVAKTLDMFGGLRSLVVRSIISTVVDNSEIGGFPDEPNSQPPHYKLDSNLGKIYSVMGVIENLSKFIFVPAYTNIYKYTVDSFPNAYFICSFAIITVVTVLC